MAINSIDIIQCNFLGIKFTIAYAKKAVTTMPITIIKTVIICIFLFLCVYANLQIFFNEKNF